MEYTVTKPTEIEDVSVSKRLRIDKFSEPGYLNKFKIADFLFFHCDKGTVRRDLRGG